MSVKEEGGGKGKRKERRRKRTRRRGRWVRRQMVRKRALSGQDFECRDGIN